MTFKRCRQNVKVVDRVLAYFLYNYCVYRVYNEYQVDLRKNVVRSINAHWKAHKKYTTAGMHGHQCSA